MHARQSSLSRARIVSLAMAVLAFTSCALAATETMLYSFRSQPDGFHPQASLVADSAGNLYGTTKFGGSNFGTVFELSPSTTAGGTWTETILYSFQGSANDGTEPMGTLVFDKQGNLYGTTWRGGSNNPEMGPGTIFELTPPATPGGAWTETVLWIFPQSGVKGYWPMGKLEMDAAGNLYGTASSGGGHVKTCTTCGVVFELVKPKTSGQPWAERVLHNFGSVAHDGLTPSPDLLLRGGVLYGTTQAGGTNKSGTAFKLDPHSGLWIETILLNFDHNNGTTQLGGFIADAAGNLFGTFFSEGDPRHCGCGMVYELSPPAVVGGTWQENVLYSFKGLSDGSRPNGPVWRDSLGDLFGTTEIGGIKTNGGAGTVFKLKAPTVSGGSWTFALIYEFSWPRTNDGVGSLGGLILQNGLFYGMTNVGGANELGTVFSVTP